MRIALELKGIGYESRAHDLKTGDQNDLAYHPSACAAAVTDRPSGSMISDFTKPPGCAGFFMRMPAIALMPTC